MEERGEVRRGCVFWTLTGFKMNPDSCWVRYFAVEGFLKSTLKAQDYDGDGLQRFGVYVLELTTGDKRKMMGNLR